jgi:acyl-CoA reductase-like NAD-dependent aldehyde dehydrogenase
MLGNAWVQGRGASFGSFSPVDGAEVAPISGASADDVDDAVAAARAALADPAWAGLRPHERAPEH